MLTQIEAMGAATASGGKSANFILGKNYGVM